MQANSGFASKTKTCCVALSLCVALLLSVASGTVGGDDEGGIYACSYEQRKTEGCDGTTWEEWQAECVDINSEDYTITPQQVCDNLTENEPHCQGGCCIKYEHRYVQVTQGSCP